MRELNGSAKRKATGSLAPASIPKPSGFSDGLAAESATALYDYEAQAEGYLPSQLKSLSNR
ncbi:hypothetical protein BGZ60DRAFT_423585 [Tricladium varicosporioides]|nr:hypothetical protein BGZ60DRAFT_423585 [Hymenoscyphus varicosporioides]